MLIIPSLRRWIGITGVWQSYPCSQVKVGRACCVANEWGTIISYELSSVAAGMEEVDRSGDRIEGESATSISSSSCGEEAYSLMSAS